MLNQNNKGKITAVNQQVTLDTNEMGTLLLGISGTFVATIQFEGFDGINWVSIKDLFNGGSAIDATATGTFRFNIAGFVAFRARCSAFTSGEADLAINATNLPTTT